MLNGRLVKRSWGWYLTLIDRNHFKVKLLWFKKDGELSLQRHEHRGEAWMFLSGIGSIGNCEDGFFTGIAKAGDYWHISRGSWHKYYAMKSTIILEVQYGDKCDERDIIRI